MRMVQLSHWRSHSGVRQLAHQGGLGHVASCVGDLLGLDHQQRGGVGALLLSNNSVSRSREPDRYDDQIAPEFV
jgi:hypothetical protein